MAVTMFMRVVVAGVGMFAHRCLFYANADAFERNDRYIVPLPEEKSRDCATPRARNARRKKRVASLGMTNESTKDEERQRESEDTDRKIRHYKGEEKSTGLKTGHYKGKYVRHFDTTRLRSD